MKNTILKLVQLYENESFTIYELAKETGIAGNVISKMFSGETKNPSRKSMEKLDNFLNNYENKTIKSTINKVKEDQAKYHVNQSGLQNLDGKTAQLIEKKDKIIQELTTELLECKNNYINLLNKKP